MTAPVTRDPGFGFVAGDHVCAFYSGSRSALDDVVVDYVASGLRSGSQVYCTVDRPAAFRSRIATQLGAGDDKLVVLAEDEAYMPGGRFTAGAFIAAVKDRISAASARGYDGFRAVGDESFIVRHRVDIEEWFAAESELNAIAGEFPHFFFCLYDLDLFDGDTVTRALKTHPRVYVNGIIIGNPHYQESPNPYG